MQLSNLMSNNIDTKTFNTLPPLHKEVVTDFFKIYENEEGSCIDRVENAIEKTAEFHNIKTDVLYNYIDNEVDAQLGVK